MDIKRVVDFLLILALIFMWLLVAVACVGAMLIAAIAESPGF